MATDVDQSSGRWKPSCISRSANRLDDQASEHEKRDKRRKPNQQIQNARFQDI